jgi:hypothetical protein
LIPTITWPPVPPSPPVAVELPPDPPAAFPPAALALPPLALDLEPDVDVAAALDRDSALLLDADPLMAAELAALFPPFFGPLLFPPLPVAKA